MQFQVLPFACSIRECSSDSSVCIGRKSPSFSFFTLFKFFCNLIRHYREKEGGEEGDGNEIPTNFQSQPSFTLSSRISSCVFYQTHRTYFNKAPWFCWRNFNNLTRINIKTIPSSRKSRSENNTIMALAYTPI